MRSEFRSPLRAPSQGCSLIENRQRSTAKVHFGPPSLADKDVGTTIYHCFACVNSRLSPPIPHSTWERPPTSPSAHIFNKRTALLRVPRLWKFLLTKNLLHSISLPLKAHALESRATPQGSRYPRRAVSHRPPATELLGGTTRPSQEGIGDDRSWEPLAFPDDVRGTAAFVAERRLPGGVPVAGPQPNYSHCPVPSTTQLMGQCPCIRDVVPVPPEKDVRPAPNPEAREVLP
jgi:hypothetical protein